MPDRCAHTRGAASSPARETIQRQARQPERLTRGLGTLLVDRRPRMTSNAAKRCGGGIGRMSPRTENQIASFSTRGFAASGVVRASLAGLAPSAVRACGPGFG